MDIDSVTTLPVISVKGHLRFCMPRCGAYLPKVSRGAELPHSVVRRGLCGPRLDVVLVLEELTL